jgi:Zn-finger nucleic acid-binding protein
LVNFGGFGFINQIPGGVMKSNHEGKGRNEVGVELKYCEHCGGLWVRERGAGTVYCEKCQPKVADLPAPKTKTRRLTLPVRPRTAVEDYTFDIDVEDVNDLEAAGSIA